MERGYGTRQSSTLCSPSKPSSPSELITLRQCTHITEYNTKTMFDRTTTKILNEKRAHIMSVLSDRTMIDFYKIGSTDLALENDVELVGMTNGEFQITYKDHWMLDSREVDAFNNSIRASFYMGCDEVMTWVEMILDELKD